MTPPTLARASRRAGLALVIAAGTGATGALAGAAFARVSGDRMAPWLLGRAAGITSYLLLVALVTLGLVLAHPKAARWRRPSRATRIRLHVGLAVFTLVFTALHIIVLATDHYAGVGWRGALLPMGATYRPLPVTLGLLALYSGLLTGLTASLAGRLARRVWWPVHKVSAVALLLVWTHGVLAGSDAPVLMWGYLVTGAVPVALAVTRYAARTPADLVDELSSRLATRQVG